METIILKGHQTIARLKHAIKGKDRNGIEKTLKRATLLDWTSAPIYLFEEYNRLMKEGNKIIQLQ